MKLWLEEEKFRPYHLTYMSHESQDEFIQLLATETKRNIVHEVVEAGIYSVMADKHQIYRIVIKWLYVFDIWIRIQKSGSV